jgi:hypothetical protein
MTHLPMTDVPMSQRRSDRRLGLLVLAIAGLLVLGVQAARPVGVPLYDGVVVQEPYRFLHPASGQPGAPTSYTSQKAVAGDLSPSFAAATSENPPQAQLVSQKGAFTLTAGATQVLLSIPAIEPPPAPTGGTIAGNVYRFSVTDQAGTPLDVRQCAGCLSLLLRAPDGTEGATIKRYANGAWQDVETVHAGMVDLYQTNATAMGDYAVVSANNEAPPDEGLGRGLIFGLDPIVAIGGALVVVLLVIGAFLLFGVRQAPREPEPASRTRIPSKRKGRR